jgi:large subunit ribosomal protein L9
MKIVLRQDVPKLGEAGTIHEVANGYARNYLIPQGMAILATPGEVKVAEHNLAVKERRVARQEAQLQALADRIDGQRLGFTVRAGEQGRLYGSITAADIAADLGKLVGEEIDRRKVVLEDPIRTVGEHAVVVHLVGRLRPKVTIVVAGELEDGTPVTLAPAAAAAGPADDDAATTAAVDGAGGGSMSERDERGRTPGAAGHPEPGSQHDDSKTETVDDGPDVPIVDGVPGADGEVEGVGGVAGETVMEGKAAEITLGS